jgi:hypothetical protein
VGGCYGSNGDDVALATGANLGLDLHGGLLHVDGAAAGAAGADFGLDLHGGLLDVAAEATGTNLGLDLHGGLL